MVGELILGKLDPDLACAIALGLVECPRVSVCLEGVSLYDERLNRIGSEREWLDPDDQLHQATRSYLLAQREMHRASARPAGYGSYGSWEATANARKRQQAVTQALEARTVARLHLMKRGTLDAARRAGLAVRD